MTRKFTLCIVLSSWAHLFYSGMSTVNLFVNHPLFMGGSGAARIHTQYAEFVVATKLTFPQTVGV